jgi:hypothetical protein
MDPNTPKHAANDGLIGQGKDIQTVPPDHAYLDAMQNNS